MAFNAVSIPYFATATSKHLFRILKLRAGLDFLTVHTIPGMLFWLSSLIFYRNLLAEWSQITVKFLQSSNLSISVYPRMEQAAQARDDPELSLRGSSFADTNSNKVTVLKDSRTM